jgi:hypothetical protein
MSFEDYFRKMCGDSSDENSGTSFKVNGTNTPFNKKELRWLKDQLETCLEWDDTKNKKSKKYMYKNMLKKVEERLNQL